MSQLVRPKPEPDTQAAGASPRDQSWCQLWEETLNAATISMTLTLHGNVSQKEAPFLIRDVKDISGSSGEE